uniref:Pyrin domain-containing protein n=1 Tax=Hippocampus comes TaxID=109280 RepID=A0A3Q3DFW2_HIPCM
MTPKRVLAIADTLENLSKADYDKFCMFLVDGHGERRVPLSKVEGKNFLEVTNVLVNFFTEDEAVVITWELLMLIGCLQQAKELSKSPLCVCVCLFCSGVKRSAPLTYFAGVLERGRQCLKRHFARIHSLHSKSENIWK